MPFYHPHLHYRPLKVYATNYSQRPMIPLVIHVTIFANFSAQAGLYRQFAHRPMILLALPFRRPNVPISHRKSPNPMALPPYHFTNISALFMFTPTTTQSANGPTGLPFFTYISARAGIYLQLARQAMALLVLPFSGRRTYQLYIVNMRTSRICHFTIPTYISAL